MQRLLVLGARIDKQAVRFNIYTSLNVVYTGTTTMTAFQHTLTLLMHELVQVVVVVV